MKINVAVCRKEGRANYGSEGASCSIEFELSAETAQNVEVRDAAIARAYKLADDAVSDQLARSAADPTPQRDDDRERGEARRDPAPRDDDRRSSRPDDRYDNRNAEPPRRDDRDRYDDRGGGRRGGRGQGDHAKNWRETNDTPRTGGDLWGFAKDFDEVKWFTDFGRSRDLPKQFKDWHRDDVADAVHEFFAKRSASAGNGRRN